MPELAPFRGLRYDGRAVRLGDVIAPPYDVISSAERARLANRDAANSVLVELPEPDLAAGRDRYQVAQALLARWRGSGLLVPDGRPSLYPYRMTTPDRHRSTGVIGALVLGQTGSGDILPHEQTMPKARSDRLELLRATRMNLSPIWGLSLATGLTATLPTDGPPAEDAFDDDGIRHQLWVADDPDAIAAIAATFATAPVVIADGHHRYETAIAYREERRARGPLGRPGRAADGEEHRLANGSGRSHDGAIGLGENAVMALVVELAEDQLHVGAIHRTISGLPPGTDVPAAFDRWFEVVRAGPTSDRTLAALTEAGSMALVTRDETYLLLPSAEAYDMAGSDLDSSLVELVLDDLPRHDVTPRHSPDEAVSVVTSGQAQAAILLRPVTVAQIAEWADARRRMPPKTTYFTPKPRTGMVFRSLDD